MTILTWTIIIVGVTFALYIGIAIWSRAGSTKEFYVAGGGVHPIANGLATAADWMSAASFISMAGLISFMAMTAPSTSWAGRAAMYFSHFYLPLTYASLASLPCLILLATVIIATPQEPLPCFARYWFHLPM
jgi:Na+/proline symporter